MAQYGINVQLSSGDELVYDRNDEGMLLGQKSLGGIWRRYSQWVLGRVHTEKCLLKADTKKLPEGEFKYPFDVTEGLLGAIGFAAEANEVLDEHKKLLFHGSDYQAKREKIVEETGDTLWYLVVLLAAHGITLEEVLAANVDKLVKKDGLDGSKFSERAKSGL